jgi:hypothetical protein
MWRVVPATLNGTYASCVIGNRSTAGQADGPPPPPEARGHGGGRAAAPGALPPPTAAAPRARTCQRVAAAATGRVGCWDARCVLRGSVCRMRGGSGGSGSSSDGAAAASLSYNEEYSLPARWDAQLTWISGAPAAPERCRLSPASLPFVQTCNRQQGTRHERTSIVTSRRAWWAQMPDQGVAWWVLLRLQAFVIVWSNHRTKKTSACPSVPRSRRAMGRLAPARDHACSPAYPPPPPGQAPLRNAAPARGRRCTYSCHPHSHRCECIGGWRTCAGAYVRAGATTAIAHGCALSHGGWVAAGARRAAWLLLPDVAESPMPSTHGCDQSCFTVAKGPHGGGALGGQGT